MQRKTSKQIADPLIPLQEIGDLLAAHPKFRVPVVNPFGTRRPASLFGRVIRDLGLLRFGAAFEGGLTLLSFRAYTTQKRRLVVEVQWHLVEARNDLAAFIHFIDQQGNILFQGDYSFYGQPPDAFGMLYSRRTIEVPAHVPDGTYAVRVGIWSPAAASHVRLTRFRGCSQEKTDWCRNAVLLRSITV